MTKIRLILVDDHKLLTDTWTLLLNSNPRFRVVAATNKGDEAIDLVKEFLPDIVLVDIAMTPLDGIELTRRTAFMFPQSKVIGLSLYGMKVYVKKMLEVGARGYVTKNSSKEELFTAIQRVYAGSVYICGDIRDKKINEPSGEQDTLSSRVNKLTAKELDIITWVKQGFSSKEISNKIRVSQKTVEVHR